MSALDAGRDKARGSLPGWQCGLENFGCKVRTNFRFGFFQGRFRDRRAAEAATGRLLWPHRCRRFAMDGL